MSVTARKRVCLFRIVNDPNVYDCYSRNRPTALIGFSAAAATVRAIAKKSAHEELRTRVILLLRAVLIGAGPLSPFLYKAPGLALGKVLHPPF
jgi:hypothetical protein